MSLQQTTIFAEYARWLRHNYNIPIPANKCSIQNKYTLLNKSNLPLGQCSVFLQGQYPNKTWSTAWKVAPGPLKECSVHFQMCSPRFKGAMPPLEKPIFLHNICSIIWQRACLSKVQYVWNCENYWRTLKNALMLLTTEQQNIVLYGRESSCEEAAFLENWTCIWHVYSSPWSDQPSLHLDNSHLKKCFQYYRTIMFSFNRISHSYQGDVAQIQQQILQGRPYSFKRVLHA